MTPQARSLDEWLALIAQRHPLSIELGLPRVEAVARRLGLLKTSAKVITVAGTNGKGSCIAFLEYLLAAHKDLVVGSYTSPHLVHYEERIRVAGQPVPAAEICHAFTAIEEARGDIGLTYFEFGTLAALLVLKKRRVDVLLLEVGLGGRLDAVNIMDSDVAIITSVAMDHMAWLGADRNAIAIEKAGIARAGKPVICGETNPPSALLPELHRIGAKVVQLGSEAFDCRHRGETLTLTCVAGGGAVQHYANLQPPELPLPSAACAVQALGFIGMLPSPRHVAAAFANTRLAGRFQRLSLQHRKLVLDVAHNPAAACLLADKLAMELSTRAGKAKLHGLFAVMADKDISGIVEPLLPLVAQWHVCDLAAVPRAATALQIADKLALSGVDKDIVAGYTSVKNALNAALSQLKVNDLLVIFGSFYTVAEAMAAIEARRAEGL